MSINPEIPKVTDQSEPFRSSELKPSTTGRVRGTTQPNRTSPKTSPTAGRVRSASLTTLTTPPTSPSRPVKSDHDLKSMQPKSLSDEMTSQAKDRLRRTAANANDAAAKIKHSGGKAPEIDTPYIPDYGALPDLSKSTDIGLHKLKPSKRMVIRANVEEGERFQKLNEKMKRIQRDIDFKLTVKETKEQEAVRLQRIADQDHPVCDLSDPEALRKYYTSRLEATGARYAVKGSEYRAAEAGLDHAKLRLKQQKMSDPKDKSEMYQRKSAYAEAKVRFKRAEKELHRATKEYKRESLEILRHYLSDCKLSRLGLKISNAPYLKLSGALQQNERAAQELKTFLDDVRPGALYDSGIKMLGQMTKFQRQWEAVLQKVKSKGT